ncbi:GNAT family N-acetyltransferase [Rothia sp. P7181]|uniref:GNAT family N-acetyltransferase n=1 Tax=unclassified Rothia (in: high G+C Gram-positive bacteria) TaxID=2689056 RepID=UPI003ACE7AA2
MTSITNSMPSRSPRDVEVIYLQMFSDPGEFSGFPEGVYAQRVMHPQPEFIRWLYSVVGGPYYWYERLSWSREQWDDELSEVGSELWVLYVEGTPCGYAQLDTQVIPRSDDEFGSDVELLYFGLMQWVHGRGLGKAFLEYVLTAAWKMSSYHAIPEVQRVWVHTCTLDGPYALKNYCRRGFEEYRREVYHELVFDTPMSSWESMFSR